MHLASALELTLLLLVLGVAGAATARQASGRIIVYGGCFAVCAALFGLAAEGLLNAGAGRAALSVPLGLPWLGAHFAMDALAAVFLGIVNLGGAMASLYGLGYGRHESEPDRILPFYPLFLAGMNLVVLADDAFAFLVSWEFMSLSSWALVLAHHREKANLHAGYVYLVMASAGTVALLLAFGMMAGSGGDYAFAAIREHVLSAGSAAAVLALVLVGAGSKAGLVPLHAWLPLAHPAAPSHVSALMSGVMTKVAVYAVVRILFDLVGGAQWWWGAIVLALGGLTAVMGVLYALMQHDLKRLLAYHTVENIGIIFIGLGLALAFQANGLVPAAALALSAALFHVFNHSVFKSLLFFGAGAVQTATGERDMERLGGLIARMPQTACLFLVGSAAISALPPLNGFASEWLTLQAILISPALPQWALKFLVPAVGALLALSAALAAACFVKAFGITFLGRARSQAVANADETDLYSRASMAVLAGICLFAGIAPGVAIEALTPAVRELVGGATPAAASANWLVLMPFASQNSYSGIVVFALVIFAAAFTFFVVRLVGSSRLRRAPAWDCGFPDPNPATQYTADSFAEPIRRVFGRVVFHARETVDMPPPGDVRPAAFHVRLRDYAWELLYLPVAAAVDYAAGRFNRVQFFSIRRYLTMVFGALILLLSVVALWR
ncbi:MAG: hydrogenase 4 subunit B [Alphaproteobacteria bacterium]